jgi:hypothetical protein
VDARSDSKTLAGIRRGLLAMLLVGLTGTGVELILLGHVEGATQYIPLILSAVALATAVWHAIRPTRLSVKALQVVMCLCLIAGAAGVVLHYRGNLEFELEMYPTMSGTELITKVATGATPILAPGTMTLLGAIGLLHAHRHPAVVASKTLQEERS